MVFWVLFIPQWIIIIIHKGLPELQRNQVDREGHPHYIRRDGQVDGQVDREGQPYYIRRDGQVDGQVDREGQVDRAGSTLLYTARCGAQGLFGIHRYKEVKVLMNVS